MKIDKKWQTFSFFFCARLLDHQISVVVVYSLLFLLYIASLFIPLLISFFITYSCCSLFFCAARCIAYTEYVSRDDEEQQQRQQQQQQQRTSKTAKRSEKRNLKIHRQVAFYNFYIYKMLFALLECVKDSKMCTFFPPIALHTLETPNAQF